MNPKLLRQYARDCERMSKECVDLFTHEALVELAFEFRRAAEEIESGSKAKRRQTAQGSSRPRAGMAHGKIGRQTPIAPKRQRILSSR